MVVIILMRVYMFDGVHVAYAVGDCAVDMKNVSILLSWGNPLGMASESINCSFVVAFYLVGVVR